MAKATAASIQGTKDAKDTKDAKNTNDTKDTKDAKTTQNNSLDEYPFFEIVQNVDGTSTHKRRNWMSADSKTIMLTYPPFAKGDDSTDVYDAFFNALNDQYQVYDKTHELQLETDFIHHAPSTLVQFKALKKLTIAGSRWFSLHMLQLPTSIVELDLTAQSNLPGNVCGDADDHVNLQILRLDYKPFYLQLIQSDADYAFDSEERVRDGIAKVEAISDLPQLFKIKLVLGGRYEETELVNDWKTTLKNHILLSKLKHRIQSISFNGQEFIVELNVKGTASVDSARKAAAMAAKKQT